jgi:hypothetical protein
MTSDFDPESTQDRAKRIHDLLADKGNVLGTGTVVVPGPRGEPEASDEPTSESHSISVVQYLDADGHVHAVMIDEVHSHSPTKGHVATLEILADVVIA